LFSIRVEREKLGDSDSDDTGNDLTEECISWLREGGLDDAEFDHGGGTLVDIG
jgi:hypothetical protein